MALAITRRFGEVVVAETVHPEYRQVLATFLEHLEPELVTVAAHDGQVSGDSVARAVSDQTAAVIFQYPNFLGQLEDVQAIVKAAHDRGALAIVVFDPISVGLLKRPIDYGADIAVAEGQSLGNHLCYGGPYLGIMVCREEYVRKMPGRIVGRDDRPERKPLLGAHAPDPRAAHPPREGDVEYLHQSRLACASGEHVPGRDGPERAPAGGRALRRARRITQPSSWPRCPGVSLAFAGPFFKEFVVEVQEAGRASARQSCSSAASTAESTSADSIPSLPTASWSPSPRNEPKPKSTAWPKRSLRQLAQRQNYVTVIWNDCDHVQTGSTPPALRVESRRTPHGDLARVGRARAAAFVAHSRGAPEPGAAPLPELTELDVVRHYTNLSTLNMSIDSNFYPLGSCTMKYNPKRNERLAGLPGLRRAASVCRTRARSRACWRFSSSFRRSWRKSPGCTR